MYTCMYLCWYACMVEGYGFELCTYVCVCVYVYICLYVRICPYVFVCTCMHVFTWWSIGLIHTYISVRVYHLHACTP